VGTELPDLGLEPIGVFGPDPGGHFLGLPVRPVAELAHEECDGIVLATFDRPEGLADDLAALGLPVEKFVTLRRPAPKEKRSSSA